MIKSVVSKGAQVMLLINLPSNFLDKISCLSNIAEKIGLEEAEWILV